MYLENATEVIECAKAYNKKDATLRFALELAIAVLEKELKEEQAKEEHKDLSKDEDDIGFVRCKNCNMWSEGNDIVLAGKIQENKRICTRWSGKKYTFVTDQNNFCCYGCKRAK